MFKPRGTLVGIGSGIALLVAQNALAFKLISYDGKAARWDHLPIPYTMDKRGSQDFHNGCDAKGPCVSEFDAIRASFAGWASVDGVKLAFQEKPLKVFGSTGYDNENSLVFVESGWTSQSYSPPPGALAVSVSTYRTGDNAILDSDIHFNGEFFRWGVVDSIDEEQGGDVVDIQNIATHEIGHFIGLDHSSENIYEADQNLYLATMFFASGPGETFRRELHEDDIDAVRHLYPTNATEDPAVDTIDPGVIDAYQGSALVTITGGNFNASTNVVIATRDDRGDVTGRILSIDRNSIQAAFDVSTLYAGTYDVVVANAYDAIQRTRNAIQINGDGYAANNSSGQNGLASESTGGCSIGGNGSDRDTLASVLLLLVLPLALIGWSRFQFVPNRKKITN
ncbi:MAG: matrixin family metalloprotease [Pseudomonadota bacterium]